MVLCGVCCVQLMGIILSIALCLAVREQQQLKHQQQHAPSPDADDVDNSLMKTETAHEPIGDEESL